MREPGPVPPADARLGLEFSVAATPNELAEFERANFAANEDQALLACAPLSVHGARTLEDAGVHYLMGRLDGEIVTSSVAYARDGMVGVYGIATAPRHRRRGYGTALVREITALRPDLHVSTWPAPESVRIYTPFGFMVCGDVAEWRSRPAR